MIMPVETGRDPSGYTVVNRWRTAAPAHIIEFVDLDTPKPQRRKKGA